MASYHWHRYSASEGFQRIQRGENPWVALGDFLDDWLRSDRADRLTLVEQPLEKATTPEEEHWGALFAATVEQLCAQEQFPRPAWSNAPRYYLQEPWYPEARTENLRRFLKETTPEIFKKHNVFGGENILSRV
ncbi:MAG: hypothetical protein ACRDHW_03235 [Ktedonobacteraceae bacterium]